jgi:hypothetical protein
MGPAGKIHDFYHIQEKLLAKSGRRGLRPSGMTRGRSALGNLMFAALDFS